MIINNRYQNTTSYYKPSNKDAQVTWDTYFSNYNSDNFEEKHGVQSGDLKTFAEKYNLNITRLPNITYDDLIAGNDLFSPFVVTENLGYNKSENSISLVSGIDIDLGRGMVLKIKDNMVDVYCSDNRLYDEDNYRRAAQTGAALNKFIRYANGQGGSFGFDDDQRKFAASVLERMGINTDQPFVVNGTCFSTSENGRGTLEKVGVNPLYTMLPKNMMEYVLEKYESNFKWA